ncbi:MAG: response regulator transcription factor, partial [Chlorobi bacterium]|nr:response regulator transcription factor [Chlorobiota bacterium]
MEILIADDSEMIRDSLKKLLASIKGIDKIDEAEDVPHAIERVRKLHPDMLILDIKMPGGNGFDVLEAAKK